MNSEQEMNEIKLHASAKKLGLREAVFRYDKAGRMPADGAWLVNVNGRETLLGYGFKAALTALTRMAATIPAEQREQ